MVETLFLPPNAPKSVVPSAKVWSDTLIAKRINDDGKHRNIREVRRIELGQHFPHFGEFKSKFVGAICTSTLCDEQPAEHFNNTATWHERRDDRLVEHSIAGYVVLTPTEIASRNSFVAQSLFPFLFAEIGAIDSPCRILSTKPIYFICMLNEVSTSDLPESIKQDMNAISSAGIKVLSLYESCSLVSRQQLSLGQLEAQQGSYRVFSVDEDCRRFQVELDGLNKILDDQGEVHGSNEKYVMLKLLPAAILACRSGYSIDASQYTDWFSQLKIDRSKSKHNYLSNAGKFLLKLEGWS